MYYFENTLAQAAYEYRCNGMKLGVFCISREVFRLLGELFSC
jgi:hypothetical protein